MVACCIRPTSSHHLFLFPSRGILNNWKGFFCAHGRSFSPSIRILFVQTQFLDLDDIYVFLLRGESRGGLSGDRRTFFWKQQEKWNFISCHMKSLHLLKKLRILLKIFWEIPPRQQSDPVMRCVQWGGRFSLIYDSILMIMNCLLSMLQRTTKAPENEIICYHCCCNTFEPGRMKIWIQWTNKRIFNVTQKNSVGESQFCASFVIGIVMRCRRILMMIARRISKWLVSFTFHCCAVVRRSWNSCGNHSDFYFSIPTLKFSHIAANCAISWWLSWVGYNFVVNFDVW
jgi:hypothetical protein